MGETLKSITIFVPEEFADEFDNTIRKKYSTRSEAIREAMRNLIIKLKTEKREDEKEERGK